MTVNFCKQWARFKKRPIEIWDTERARSAYNQRELHVALVGAADTPEAFLEFNKDYVGVNFLDSAKREYLSFTFAEVEPKRLFLQRAAYREFAADSDKVKSASTYFFKPDGSVTIENKDFDTGKTATQEQKADLAGNWDDYPAFGQYDSLLRKER